MNNTNQSGNTLRTFALLAIAITFCTLPRVEAVPITWTGTITGTASNAPSLVYNWSDYNWTIGYSYESESPNGRFFTRYGPLDFIPLSIWSVSGWPMLQHSIIPIVAHIEVSNSHITGFYEDGIFTVINRTDWMYEGPHPSEIVFGHLTWTDPIPEVTPNTFAPPPPSNNDGGGPSAGVPDGGSSLAMVSMGLATLFAWRHHRSIGCLRRH